MVGAALAALLPVGCNPFATHLSPEHSLDPIKPVEYPLTYKEKPKKGEDFVVAMFVNTTASIRHEFEGIELELDYYITKEFQEMAKEGKLSTKLAVLDPTQVNKFKRKNPTWERMHQSEWGRHLNVDFVFDIHLEKMQLYQPGSNNQVYEGRAQVAVNVYDVDAGIAEPKYNYVLPFSYPQTGLPNAGSVTPSHFKQDFLEHLGAELSMKHVPHKEGLDIVTAGK